MEPTKGTGDKDPGTTKSTDTKTNAAGADNDSQQTLACRDCDSTNIRRIQGDTGVGALPTGEGPYACNDCGWHGEPLERAKRTKGTGRRGLAGKLVGAESDDLRADGGEDIETVWTLTCLDCDFDDEILADGHPRDGPPTKVEQRVTRHKHTEDQSHVVRVAGRRADRDDSIDPSLVTDGGHDLAEAGADRRPSADIDGVLRLDDRGLHLPDWLVGHVGEFTMRTPNVDGTFNTTPDGLGDVCSVLGAVPEAGEYNDDLEAGHMALSAPGHDERIYRVDDQRDDEPAPIAGEGGAAGGAE